MSVFSGVNTNSRGRKVWHTQFVFLILGLDTDHMHLRVINIRINRVQETLFLTLAIIFKHIAQTFSVCLITPLPSLHVNDRMIKSALFLSSPVIELEADYLLDLSGNQHQPSSILPLNLNSLVCYSHQ